MELALRFLVFRKKKEADLSRIGDVGEFLTDSMVSLIENKRFDRQEEERIFRKTFDYLATNYGLDAFRRYDPMKKKHLGGFLHSAFEVVALGIGFHDGKSKASASAFASQVQGMWTDLSFQQWSGSGVRASSRIPKLIPLGRGLFRP